MIDFIINSLINLIVSKKMLSYFKKKNVKFSFFLIFKIGLSFIIMVFSINSNSNVN